MGDIYFSGTIWGFLFKGGAKRMSKIGNFSWHFLGTPVTQIGRHPRVLCHIGFDILFGIPIGNALRLVCGRFILGWQKSRKLLRYLSIYIFILLY